MSKHTLTESFTTEQASKLALDWCKNNKGWQRICDIEDSDALYKNWDEISKKDKAQWKRLYPVSTQDAWEEFATKVCKVKLGFISGKGEFYNCYSDIPDFHNGMMVFKTH